MFMIIFKHVMESPENAKLYKPILSDACFKIVERLADEEDTVKVRHNISRSKN
jgi:hypothetical protein